MVHPANQSPIGGNLPSPQRQLIDPTTQQIIAIVQNNHVHFKQDWLKNELEINGIPIPGKFRGQYNGKSVVYPKDQDFARAFVEIHFPRKLKEGGLELH